MTSPDAAQRAPSRFGPQARVHLERVLRCDFTRMAATEPERQTLRGAPSPTTQDKAQDLLAWRRSMALFAATFAAGALVFALIELIDSLSEFSDSPQITAGASVLVSVLFGSKLALLGGLMISIWAWHDARRSRLALLLGWGTAVAVPLLVILLPISEVMFDWSQTELEGGAQATALLRGVTEAMLAIGMFWTAVPSLLALFPGLLRAGLTVKTLLPSRAVGPTAAAAMAPIYAVFFVTVFGQILQLSGSAMMSVGVLAVAAAPLVYVWRAKALTRPLSAEDARGWVAAVRGHARIVTGLGLGLVFAGLLGVKLFGVRMVGLGTDEAMFSIWSVADTLLWFVAMLTTYTVVATDGLLRLMHAADTHATAHASAQGRAADDEALRATQAAPTTR